MRNHLQAAVPYGKLSANENKNRAENAGPKNGSSSGEKNENEAFIIDMWRLVCESSSCHCKRPNRSKICKSCERPQGSKLQESPKCVICANAKSNNPKGVTVDVLESRHASATKSQWRWFWYLVSLNHCNTVRLLLRHAIGELKCGFIIIWESPRNGNWIADRANTVATWTVGKYAVQKTVYCADEDFVIVKINWIYYVAAMNLHKGR